MTAAVLSLPVVCYLLWVEEAVHVQYVCVFLLKFQYLQKVWTQKFTPALRCLSSQLLGHNTNTELLVDNIVICVYLKKKKKPTKWRLWLRNM